MCTNKKGIIPMFIGLLLIVAALILVLYNLWDGKRAQEASDGIVAQLDKAIPDGEPGLPVYGVSGEELSAIEIDGYNYIGILEIPSLSLRLPVMENWDYERLKISSCRYSGSYCTEDMVICAHNYAKHFGSIKWMNMGDDVYFVTVEGKVYHYQVNNMETIEPSEIGEMIDNTENDWNLTLFTCNADGQTRCAVRCVKIQ